MLIALQDGEFLQVESIESIFIGKESQTLYRKKNVKRFFINFEVDEPYESYIYYLSMKYDKSNDKKQYIFTSRSNSRKKLVDLANKIVSQVRDADPELVTALAFEKAFMEET